MLAIRNPKSIEKRQDKLRAAPVLPRPATGVRPFLEHLQDLEDLYLAERALERVRSGEERTVLFKNVVQSNAMPHAVALRIGGARSHKLAQRKLDGY